MLSLVLSDSTQSRYERCQTGIAFIFNNERANGDWWAQVAGQAGAGMSSRQNTGSTHIHTLLSEYLSTITSFYCIALLVFNSYYLL